MTITNSDFHKNQINIMYETRFSDLPILVHQTVLFKCSSDFLVVNHIFKMFDHLFEKFTLFTNYFQYGDRI